MNKQQISVATMTAAADLTAAIVMRCVGSAVTGTKDGQYLTQSIVAKVACIHVRDQVMAVGN